MKATLIALALQLWAGSAPARGQAAQNPSPMVEHTREHRRLKLEQLPGRRLPLEVGTLFLPENLPARNRPLFFHFHGGARLPEVAAARCGTAVVAVQLGAGSGAYGKPFADPELWSRLVRQAEAAAGGAFEPIVLTAWSAGYGAVRAILKVPANYDRIDAVLLLDGLHAGYVGGKPGPQESTLAAEDLEVFVRWGRDAVRGGKRLMVTHTEIFPGTFASTTETADYLLKALGLQRRAVLQWGPMGTQQLSEARQGNFLLLGYAGNAAPDHVDQLHALPDHLTSLLAGTKKPK